MKEMTTTCSVATSDPQSESKPQELRDLFDKCREFTRPRDLQEAGLYMYFEVFTDRDGCEPGEVKSGSRKILMFGSNDYLSLINHREVKEKAAKAARKYGTGCSGSRLLNGTLDLHVQLEEQLAKLMRKEAAILFSTGFQANYAALATLAGKGDVLLCDHNLHASLIEGALRSPARLLRFHHNDVKHLERGLRNCAPEDGILIVSEGIFSMEGDMADLPAIVGMAKAHRARVYVDEAHGLGILGPNGAGVAEHLGVLDDIDIVMGTFTKSLASVGGFLASCAPVIDFLKHTARPFVFSASLPPSTVAAASAALDIVRREPERRLRVLALADRLRRGLRSCGFSVLDGESPIVPVVIENEVDLCRLCKSLMAKGIYVNPVLRPAAIHNLLRISCTAGHTDAQLDRLIDTLDHLAKKMGINAAR